MPIDRFGNKIFIGWSATEIIWLEAALTLSPVERKAAFLDISAMAGRSLACVQNKAYQLRAIGLAERVAQVAAERRVRAFVPAAASTIRPPTKAQRMCGRAR